MVAVKIHDQSILCTLQLRARGQTQEETTVKIAMTPCAGTVKGAIALTPISAGLQKRQRMASNSDSDVNVSHSHARRRAPARYQADANHTSIR